MAPVDRPRIFPPPTNGEAAILGALLGLLIAFLILNWIGVLGRP